MRWDLSFKRQALGDPVSEGRRVWEWIQQIRPLHPSLDLWRTQATSNFPDFGLAPAFSGQIGQGNKLMLSFNKPDPGNAGIVLMIGDALGAALDASEDLADTLTHTTATIFTPNTIGALTRKERPRSATPPPYRYLPGWKMFFTSDSPHYQRATQLATRTAPVANGAIFTFGT